MTQPEQNKPVRTRVEQLVTYPETVCVGQYPGKSWVLEIDVDDLDPDQLVEDAVSYVRADIAYNCEKQAEARGAAEQRRKDAEGRKWTCNVAGETFVTVDSAVAAEWERGGFFVTEHSPANVAALEARIAELEAEKADAGWTFLAGNMSGDPRLPSCRLSRLFQEGDTFSRFKQSAEEFGIEVILKSDEREEEEWDEELSAEMLSRLDQYEHLIADGWSFVDVWDDEDSNIVRLFARPIRASLTREGGV